MLSSTGARAAIVLIPVGVFLMVLGAVMATSAEDEPPVPPQSAHVEVVATATIEPTALPPTVTPAATPVYRTDCAAIRGSSYLSDEERAWFVVNCPTPTAAPSTARVVSAPVAAPRTDTSKVYGTTDRLVISRLGINAPVNISVVGADGAMGTPLGANDVVLYDFSAIPGLGGYPPQGGNAVIAGHVDYICCPAVFAGLRNIQEGDIISYFSEGVEYRYEVQWFGDYPPDTNWAGLVASGPNIMTLITCNGTFDTAAREYSHRRVVRAVLVSGT